MSMKVYCAKDEGEIFNRILRDNEFEVVIGSGTIDEQLLASCDVLVQGKGYVTEQTLDAAPKLKMVSKYGVGYERIDVKACTQKNIFVSNTPGVNTISVAEHTMALILAVAKQLHPVSLCLHKEIPDNSCKARYPSFELYGKTLLVAGLGAIGRRVARLAHAFGMSVIGYDPYLPAEMTPDFVTRYDTLEEALPLADVVSLHVAGLECNRNLICDKTLRLMKPNSILINTTRGLVVNERDLYQALVEKRIAGAGLDVFADEPLLPGNPLLTLENVVTTAHCAANTKDAQMRTQVECARNILLYFSGELPAGSLNGKEIQRYKPAKACSAGTEGGKALHESVQNPV